MLGLVHPKVTELEVIAEVTNVFGFGQVGGKAHVTLAVQPGLLITPSLINLKVKHPSGLVDVNGPGIVFPQNPPAKPPGTLPAPFPLAI